jgi:hypothetical protein
MVALESRSAQDVIEMTSGLDANAQASSTEVAWLARAAALCDLDRAAEGLGLFTEWLPRFATDRYEASPHVAYWRARMGLCALAAEHRRQAIEASRLASAALARQPGASALYAACLTELDRRVKHGAAGARVAPNPPSNHSVTSAQSPTVR